MISTFESFSVQQQNPFVSSG